MRKKIIIAIIVNVIIISTGLWIIGRLTVDESIDRSLQSRLTLASIIAKNIDFLLERNLNRLYDISLSGKIDLTDNDWETEREALQTAYQYSIFTDGIFILDKTGNVLLSYPPKLENQENLLSIPYVGRIIADGKPVISDIYTFEQINKKVLYALVPLKSKHGDIVGVVGGEIDPTILRLGQTIETMPKEPNTYLEVIDSRGIIIVSNSPKRMFTSNDHNRFLENLIAEKRAGIRTCHRCHTKEDGQIRQSNDRSTDLLAFAPLEIAQWGVLIIQPEKDVFAPANNLKKTFLIFSIGSTGIALIIAIGMSRGIVKPIHKLIDASQKIALGDMSKSIAFGGKDEIGMLSSSFEVMRVKLADSLEGLRRYNIELEQRVIERTQQIRSSHKKAEILYKKVISVQEDERKRIARGLHDETMQSLSALLMKINMCKAYPEHYILQKIDEMEGIVLNTLEGIHNIIQNLRPAILDDLGLEASIRWLLDKHIGERGITYFFNVIGTGEKELDSRIKTAIFRIVQESIINISRHAEAKNVFLILRYMQDSLTVVIEDDGEGFDVTSMLKQSEDGRGLGILGMKERANLLDGRLEVCSAPNGGTRINLWIPINQYGDKNV
jgi:signal transduction histidine kinase